MRVLVCGDRYWSDREMLFSVLDSLHAARPITCVIEGEARGADTLGRLWAEAHGIQVEKFPALWERYGRAAGPIRNSQMLLEGKPDLVVGFHPDILQSKGTRNMLKIAKAAGVETKLYPDQI